MRFIYLIPIIALIFMTACNKDKNCLDPSGTITQTYYSPGAFDDIVMRGAADLVIRYDSVGSYWGSASDNMLPLWNFQVENNTLVIEPVANSCFNSSDAVFYINHPNVESLTIEGSSLVQMVNLHQNSLFIDVSGVSNIRIDSSSFTRMDVIFQGSGNLYAFDNPCDTVEVNITGQALAEVTVSDLLRVIISGDGTVRYDGMPLIEEQISGNGVINPR